MSQKVAYVTGGMGGIGTAICQRLHKEGFKVIAGCGPTRDHVKWIAEQAALGYTFYASAGNVGDWDSTVEAFEKTKAEHGVIDVLVNNAGLGTSKKIVDMADEEWDKVIGVTLTGTFRVTRAALKVMQPQGKGVIVNNASVLGWRAQTEQAHYAAAKAGVMALTRCAALEAAEFGVRINAVAPSIAIHAFLKKSASEELLNQLSEKEAFGRGAEPWEVANVMVFLASDYSSYMTGEVVSVSSQRA